MGTTAVHDYARYLHPAPTPRAPWREEMPCILTYLLARRRAGEVLGRLRAAGNTCPGAWIGLALGLGLGLWLGLGLGQGWGWG